MGQISIEYKTGFNVKPLSVSGLGIVTFTSGVYDDFGIIKVSPNQMQCEAYGYTYNQATGTCSAFRNNTNLNIAVANENNKSLGKGNSTETGTNNTLVIGENNTVKGFSRNSIISGSRNEIANGINNARSRVSCGTVATTLFVWESARNFFILIEMDLAHQSYITTLD